MANNAVVTRDSPCFATESVAIGPNAVCTRDQSFAASESIAVSPTAISSHEVSALASEHVAVNPTAVVTTAGSIEISVFARCTGAVGTRCSRGSNRRRGQGIIKGQPHRHRPDGVVRIGYPEAIEALIEPIVESDPEPRTVTMHRDTESEILLLLL